MPTTIPSLPTPPNRATDDAATFSTKADAFAGSLPAWGTAVQARGLELDAAASAAESARILAENAATTSVGLSQYRGDYAAGTTYTLGQSVSHIGNLWVAKQTTTGVAPPDTTRWFQVSIGSEPFGSF